MLKQRLILVLLLVSCFSLAIYLHSLQVTRDEKTGRSEGFLALLLGDGRQLFSNELFSKADAYFHRGNYPSIFDRNTRKEENHMSEASHDAHEQGGEHHEEEHEDVPATRDWIEALGQKFRVSAHVHLEKGEEREMLPWLRLSAGLDPHNIEAYTVSAYWLRERLKKVDEAEQFLREGLRQNPNNPDILNELAWLYFENRKDFNRARNLWRVALHQWHQIEDSKKEPDIKLERGILDGLVEVELATGQPGKAVEYLQQIKGISPNPDSVQKRIDQLNSTGSLTRPK